MPNAVHAVMACSALLCAAIGVVYTQGLMQQRWPLVPLAFALLGEAWLTSRYAKRKLGRALTADQRGRVALVSAVLTLGVLALPMLVMPSATISALVMRTRGLELAALLLVPVLVALVLACVRYVLLGVLGPTAERAVERG